MDRRESAAWDSAKKVFESRIKFFRVENSVGEGMSDLICQNRLATTFWIELKALDAWPVRAGTFPLRSAFEKGQLTFLRDWTGWGAPSFVLVRVKISHGKYDWLLLDPKRELREMTQAALKESVFNPELSLESAVRYLEQAR